MVFCVSWFGWYLTDNVSTSDLIVKLKWKCIWRYSANFLVVSLNLVLTVCLRLSHKKSEHKNYTYIVSKNSNMEIVAIVVELEAAKQVLFSGIHSAQKQAVSLQSTFKYLTIVHLLTWMTEINGPVLTFGAFGTEERLAARRNHNPQTVKLNFCTNLIKKKQKKNIWLKSESIQAYAYDWNAAESTDCG